MKSVQMVLADTQGTQVQGTADIPGLGVVVFPGIQDSRGIVGSRQIAGIRDTLVQVDTLGSAASLDTAGSQEAEYRAILDSVEPLEPPEALVRVDIADFVG